MLVNIKPCNRMKSLPEIMCWFLKIQPLSFRERKGGWCFKGQGKALIIIKAPSPGPYFPLPKEMKVKCRGGFSKLRKKF